MPNTNLEKKEWRLNNIYKIVDKEKKTIKFQMNDGQWELWLFERGLRRKHWEELWKQQDAGMPVQRPHGVWIILLKARQVGFTTLKAIDKLDTCLFHRNRSITLTAHTIQKAQEIFQNIVKFAYDSLPEAINTGSYVWQKPQAAYNNKNELFFPTLNSKIKVVVDARGTTPSDAHITEIASYKNAEAMMTALIPAIPKTSNIVVESTAEGVGNYFHDMWMKAESGKGEFVPFFYPWYKNKGYTEYVAPGELVMLDEAIRHINRLDITLGQKKWYQKMYDDLGSKIFQEYPSDAQEAFLASGRPFFHTGKVKALSRKLSYTVHHVFGDLRIYKPLENGNKMSNLLFGVDTSEGGEKGDYAVITVRNRKLELVACYRGHIQPDDLCLVIDTLWKMGYTGVLGIERNNTGIATLSKAKDYPNWYGYIYTEKKLDEKTRKITKKLGFSTDSVSRPLILSEMEEIVRKQECVEFDDREIAEMYKFNYNDKNRPEAQTGEHDDTIMADAICMHMRHEPAIVHFVS